MSVDEDTVSQADQGPAPIAFAPAKGARRGLRERLNDRRLRRAGRPKLRKRRLLFILSGFFVLAVVSLMFGALTAMTAELPNLRNQVEFKHQVESYLYDENGTPIGPLAPPNEAVIDSWDQISQNMVHAIVSVEDKTYWTNSGISIRGIGRALLSDVGGGPKEGASTIAEEFVKNVLAEEGNRTVFEKLREAGLAFQLVHHWKRTTIMTDYLNTIYFGNGAYGIEAAARTYFGWNHGYNPSDPGAEKDSGCGTPDALDPHRSACASVLYPWESALLAGMVANPYEFDPVLHPQAAKGRRNLVLWDMWQQHYISRAMYLKSIKEPLPTAKDIQQPQEPSAAPYYTQWVRPLIIDALEKEGLTAKEAQYEAYYGGLKIKLSLNLKMQAAAQQAVNAEFPTDSGMTASLVAIDNSNGEVRAMVSGDGNYAQSPFNLATFGNRQPGSAFKMFTLAAAFSSGKYSPDSVFDSKPLSVKYTTPAGTGVFVVHNFDNAYAGPSSLYEATAVSDNSVFVQLGMKAGIKNIQKYAVKMGIRSPISTTPAMILGGLSTGVTALDMAHAYETAADGGYKISNPVLGDLKQGAIGISSISGCKPCRQQTVTNAHPTRTRELSPEVDSEIRSILQEPVDNPAGTGTAAAIPGVLVEGKTGTTSNYVDAWFVGWTPQMTVAVWVGFPNSGKPMLKDFDGGPVEGGTYPAIIWHNFMIRALQILQSDGVNVGVNANDLLPDNNILADDGAATGTASSYSTSPASDSSGTTSTATSTTGNSGTGNSGTGDSGTGNSGTANGGGGAGKTTGPSVSTTPTASNTGSSSSNTGSGSGSSSSGNTGVSGGGGLIRRR